MFNWIMFVIVFVHYKKEIGIDLESNIFLVSGIDKKETIAKDFSLKKNKFIPPIYCPKNFRYRHVAFLLKVGGQTHPKKLDKKKRGGGVKFANHENPNPWRKGVVDITCNIPIT